MQTFKFTPIDELKILSRVLGQYNLNCGKYFISDRNKDLIRTLVSRFPKTIEGRKNHV